MSQPRKLSRTQWALLTIIAFAFWGSCRLCINYFHLTDFGLPIFMLLPIFVGPILHVCRNFEKHKPGDNDILYGTFLIFWLAGLAWVNGSKFSPIIAIDSFFLQLALGGASLILVLKMDSAIRLKHQLRNNRQ